MVSLSHEKKSLLSAGKSGFFGRSGTSIGANIHEAPYAQGKRDFISKLKIALKEASETGYWLELLYRTKYIDEQVFKTLIQNVAKVIHDALELPLENKSAKSCITAENTIATIEEKANK